MKVHHGGCDTPGSGKQTIPGPRAHIRHGLCICLETENNSLWITPLSACDELSQAHPTVGLLLSGRAGRWPSRLGHDHTHIHMAQMDEYRHLSHHSTVAGANACSRAGSGFMCIAGMYAACMSSSMYAKSIGGSSEPTC